MITANSVREAIANAADQHGVIVLNEHRLTLDLYTLWFTPRSRTFRQAVMSVELFSTAHSFAALEFAESIAKRVGVTLHASDPRSRGIGRLTDSRIDTNGGSDD